MTPRDPYGLEARGSHPKKRPKRLLDAAFGVSESFSKIHRALNGTGEVSPQLLLNYDRKYLHRPATLRARYGPGL